MDRHYLTQIKESQLRRLLLEANDKFDHLPLDFLISTMRTQSETGSNVSLELSKANTLFKLSKTHDSETFLFEVHYEGKLEGEDNSVIEISSSADKLDVLVKGDDGLPGFLKEKINRLRLEDINRVIITGEDSFQQIEPQENSTGWIGFDLDDNPVKWYSETDMVTLIKEREIIKKKNGVLLLSSEKEVDNNE